MRRAGAGLLALGALAFLYTRWPDKVYVFDGVMFGWVIERNVLDVGAVLFNQRHLLFIPLFLGLRDLLAWAGRAVGGYELIQAVNALAGAAGAGLFYLLAARLSRSRTLAAGAAAVLAVSCAYWQRAAEGQVYMLMTLGALAVLWAACALVDEPAPGRAWLLAAAWAASTLLHAADGFLLPVAAAAFYLSPGGARRFVPLGAACAVVALAYAAAFGIRGPTTLLGFLVSATEFGAEAGGGAGSFLRETLSRLAGLPFELARAPASLFSALVAAEGLGAVTGGLLLAGGGAWLARAAWPRLDEGRRRQLLLLAGGGAVFVLVDGVWRGGAFFWAAPAAAFLAAAALCAGALEAPPRGTALAAAALVLGGWNWAVSAKPRAALENNAGYRAALFVREHTAVTSWIATTGLAFPNSKVYLTQFSRRNNSAAEYYLREGPKAAALQKFSAHLRRLIGLGLPVYALAELVEDGRALRTLEKHWGVRREELLACFGPGRFLPVAGEGELRVYLFIPDRDREALFAGLTFNVLDMPGGPAVEESLGALTILAAAMDEPARARARALLERTRLGALLALEAMRPHLSAENLAQAERYAAAFMAAPSQEASARLRHVAGLLAPAKKK